MQRAGIAIAARRAHPRVRCLRLKLRLLNLAAGVSLLLAIAIVALWVRSEWCTNEG